jgi:hypothetical protein
MATTTVYRRPLPHRSGWWLKTAVVVPNVLIATMLWIILLAALPSPLGTLTALAGIANAVLLAAGVGEDQIVLVLYRARRPTPVEAPRLNVAWRIATHPNHPFRGRVRLRIVKHGPPVATAGRRHILLHQSVVDAYRTHQITAQDVAILLAQGIRRLECGYVRCDLLWAVWTIPWDLVRTIAVGVGRRLAWIPLVGFAWRIRFIVFTIAIINETVERHWPIVIVLASFLALSYLMPKARRNWNNWLSAASCSPINRAGA